MLYAKPHSQIDLNRSSAEIVVNLRRILVHKSKLNLDNWLVFIETYGCNLFLCRCWEKSRTLLYKTLLQVVKLLSLRAAVSDFYLNKIECHCKDSMMRYAEFVQMLLWYVFSQRAVILSKLTETFTDKNPLFILPESPTDILLFVHNQFRASNSPWPPTWLQFQMWHQHTHGVKIASASKK